MRFTFPPNQEHAESLGRLELFARYGPTDEEGQLRGGISGSHVHTDGEIHKMIEHNTREAFFSLVKKPRTQAEIIVADILPTALQENITKGEIRKLLQNVFKDESGRMNFTGLQDVVMANLRNRLQVIMQNYSRLARGKERGPKVPFQCKQEAALMAITRKKKMNIPEENYAQEKRLHAFSTSLALLEDCRDKALQINLNVTLCRHRGDTTDRWDRYCSVRRTGRSGYVKARNTPRVCADFSDGVADRHPGVSSLIATMSY